VPALGEGGQTGHIAPHSQEHDPGSVAQGPAADGHGASDALGADDPEAPGDPSLSLSVPPSWVAFFSHQGGCLLSFGEPFSVLPRHEELKRSNA